MVSTDPVVTGYRRISGGDWQVTVSLKPGTRVHMQIPAAAFHGGAIADLVPLVIERLRRPTGVPGT